MASTLFAFSQISAERLREEEKEGVIVNVISHDDFHDVSGLEGANSMITGFTHSWAKELTPFGIRVGGVVPRFTIQMANLTDATGGAAARRIDQNNRIHRLTMITLVAVWLPQKFR